ncbi:MAG: HD domain-containing protein [Streptosporangiales bacterium]|nr:HD domain-containing protein [Streptosporangiales bacterium]
MYICVIVVLALATIIRGPLSGIPWMTLVVLALLFFITESLPTPVSDRAAVSPSIPVALASAVLVGPLGACLVGFAAVVVLRRNLILVKRVFNGAQMGLAGYCAGATFTVLGGNPGVPQADDFPGIVPPFLAAVAAYSIVNALLVGGVVLLTHPPSPGAFKRRGGLRWRPLVTVELPVLGYGTLGLFIAALWAAVDFFAAVLVLLPLYIARWAFDQYVAQQRAYDATIAALCQAVETKDYYTRGHCMRVSKASAMIATEIRMRAERVEAVRLAGMLHDVGKLGVPTKVLQKSGPLSEEEFAAIQLHPMRGLEIVREIGFLDDALAGIMHHHERIDGKGYPMGLAGDEIPDSARVIAVADAFDSMTSTRSYRNARDVDEAIEELRRWSGTQFDPVMVDALIRAVERDGWRAPEPVVPPAGVVRDHPQLDHDDPSLHLRAVGESRA